MDNIKVLVTKREDSPTPGTIETPVGQPNVQLVETSIWKQCMRRAVRTTLQVLVSGLAPISAIQIMDGSARTALILLAITVVTTFCVSFGQNYAELANEWDTRFPERRG